MKKTVVYIVKIFLPLLAICAVIAGVVSGVNALTKAKIAENEAVVLQKIEERKLATIADIYGDGLKFEKLGEIPSDIDEIRAAKGEDNSIYYCVTLTVKGYSDGLQVFVAFGKSGEVKRVLILASNETSGIGSRVSDGAYLGQYAGQSGNLTMGNEVDKIAGASLSSRAVLAAVNRATAVITEMEDNAK